LFFKFISKLFSWSFSHFTLPFVFLSILDLNFSIQFSVTDPRDQKHSGELFPDNSILTEFDASFFFTFFEFTPLYILYLLLKLLCQVIYIFHRIRFYLSLWDEECTLSSRYTRYTCLNGMSSRKINCFREKTTKKSGMQLALIRCKRFRDK